MYNFWTDLFPHILEAEGLYIMLYASKTHSDDIDSMLVFDTKFYFLSTWTNQNRIDPKITATTLFRKENFNFSISFCSTKKREIFISVKY